MSNSSAYQGRDRSWLGPRRQPPPFVHPYEWLASLPYRSETRELAATFLELGRFRGRSTQLNYVTASQLAESTGKSVRTAKRFFPKLVRDGYLTAYSSSALNEAFPDKKTKLYSLTDPAKATASPPSTARERRAMEIFDETMRWANGIDWDIDPWLTEGDPSLIPCHPPQLAGGPPYREEDERSGYTPTQQEELDPARQPYLCWDREDGHYIGCRCEDCF